MYSANAVFLKWKNSKQAVSARLAQLVNAPTQAHVYSCLWRLNSRAARRDLKWYVWYCRNTVAHDVSGDNG